MHSIEAVVTKEYDGANIKAFLKHYMKLSSKRIKVVKWGGVFADGTVITMSYTVHHGQTIRVEFFDNEESSITPMSFPIDVIYEDEYIIAVNKPTNMPTHPSRGNSLPTLAEGVVAYMPDGFVFRSINRLDRDTSGVVLIAKNAYSADLFARIMRNGGFTKKYIGITDGIPYPESGIINAPIERESPDSIKRIVRDDGKCAITKYKVIKSRDNRAMLELTLYTGRTHQIRVHLAHINTPLLGDFLYGKEIPGETYRLHSGYISFIHPITGQFTEIISSPKFTL